MCKKVEVWLGDPTPALLKKLEELGIELDTETNVVLVPTDWIPTSEERYHDRALFHVERKGGDAMGHVLFVIPRENGPSLVVYNTPTCWVEWRRGWWMKTVCEDLSYENLPPYDDDY